MNNDFVSKVFRWFGIGLLITFATGYGVSLSSNMLSIIYSGPTLLIILIAELACAIWLSIRIRKMNTSLAIFLYLFYTMLTGLTFSSIFLVYEMNSIIWIFLATSIIFLLFSFIGKSTKVNLNGLGIYLLIGLLSIIILEIINMFLMNNTLDMVLCIISIIIFIGYVTYDMQRIYNMNINDDNIAIIGAFDIYLDFINLFIRLLQLFGKNKD